MATNLNKLKAKLQKALIQHGVPVKVETSQFYSEDQKRMINMYSIRSLGEKEPLIRTSSLVEIVKYLGVMFEEVNQNAKA